MTLTKIAIPDVPERTGEEFDRQVKEWIENPLPFKLPIYTYQELITVNAGLWNGYIVRCSNGDAGDECLAYCDGFNWKVIQLGSNIALS
jgi:hypothetical protein